METVRIRKDIYEQLIEAVKRLDELQNHLGIDSNTPLNSSLEKSLRTQKDFTVGAPQPSGITFEESGTQHPNSPSGEQLVKAWKKNAPKKPVQKSAGLGLASIPLGGSKTLT